MAKVTLSRLHGGYADRVVHSGKPENIDVFGKALQFIREQGFSAGLGAHALEVLQECDKRSIKPDFYVKTFHHDRYWSATPKERRKPFSVDGPPSADHNEFHDNIFCLNAEATAEFMLDQSIPWIAFKVLAAGAIPPRSRTNEHHTVSRMTSMPATESFHSCRRKRLGALAQNTPQRQEGRRAETVHIHLGVLPVSAVHSVVRNSRTQWPIRSALIELKNPALKCSSFLIQTSCRSP